MLPLADITRPTLIYSGGTWTWWAILGGFLLEWLLYGWASRLEWREIIALTLVANVITATIGLIALTVFDFARAMAGIGTFSLTTFVASYFGYTVVNTLIEFTCLDLLTKRRLTERRRGAWAMILLANALSVALPFFTMTKSPNTERFTPPWGPHAPYRSEVGTR